MIPAVASGPHQEANIPGSGRAWHAGPGTQGPRGSRCPPPLPCVRAPSRQAQGPPGGSPGCRLREARGRGWTTTPWGPVASGQGDRPMGGCCPGLELEEKNMDSLEAKHEKE